MAQSGRLTHRSGSFRICIIPVGLVAAFRRALGATLIRDRGQARGKIGLLQFTRQGFWLRNVIFIAAGAKTLSSTLLAATL